MARVGFFGGYRVDLRKVNSNMKAVRQLQELRALMRVVIEPDTATQRASHGVELNPRKVRAKKA